MHLKDIYNLHKGQSVLILGCGESRDLPDMNEYDIIFGVNYIQQYLPCNYLLVIDKKENFNEERQSIILNKKIKSLFTCISDWDSANYTNKIIFELGTLNLQNFGNKEGIVDHSIISPYVAILICYYLGFSKIDVAGVDILTHDKLKNYRDVIKKDLTLLKTVLGKKGCKLTNLSPAFRW